ncbi:MAG: hypothetical protein H7Y89_19545 [Steroidobacteraceae bacterium]|nr:hypothetical protein [Steroidobacteraceae bacterium]
MKEKLEVLRRPQVDLCKLEELERLARRTESLAMDIACQLHDSTDSSGYPDPPKLVAAEASLDGSGYPDPPRLDAIVDIAAGAKSIRDGVNSLR